MKLALVLTTINVPDVLKLYRAVGPDIEIFVAGDTKTPAEASNFCASIGATYLSPETQKSLGYACSDLLGFSTIGRRNIATLEALKDGADVLVFCDDDNIPVDPFYFGLFERVLNWRKHPDGLLGSILFDGIMVDETEWFDVGTLLDPVSPHRGFPHDRAQAPNFSCVTSARVGVAAGICFGDPDIDAATRISSHPVVHRCSELLRSGVVVDPRRTRTVFNSQNTAFIRELAPCFLMVPSYGRYDDIFASLVAQRVMREWGYYVHFGQPFVWQSRNPHNLLNDLAKEQWGAEHIIEFSAWLDGFLGVHDIIGFLKVMATNLPKFIPSGTQELWLAWLQDCESVMK